MAFVVPQKVFSVTAGGGVMLGAPERSRLQECSAQALTIGAVLAGSVPSEEEWDGVWSRRPGQSRGCASHSAGFSARNHGQDRRLGAASDGANSRREAAALTGKFFGASSRGTERSQGNFPAFPLARKRFLTNPL